MKGDEIVRPCDRHSNDTVTLRKYVTKYKHMRKWMVEFFRKFENLGIKLLELTQLISANMPNYFHLLSYLIHPLLRGVFLPLGDGNPEL